MNISPSQAATSQTLSALRQSRRIHFIRAALVGICAGCVAVLFKWCIDAVSHSLHFFTDLSGHPILRAFILIFFCCASGFIASFLTQRYSPDASGSGIPHVKAVLLHLREMRFSRVLPVKFVGGMLAIGSGFSLGREGPTVHLGAAMADGIARFLKVPLRSRNHLVACGAGAGLAAAFNAPLAGFIFVIEELRRDMSPITYGAALIGAVIADGVARFFLGTAPSLNLSVHTAPSLWSTPIILLIGLIGGAGGVLFNQTLLYGLKKVPATLALWKRGAMAGLCIGIATLLVPYSTANLQETIDHFLQAHSGTSIALWIFGGYFLLKFLLTGISYLSGVPGGIFAPMLIQGALLGIFIGRLGDLVLPFGALPDGIYGILGMCAFFAASVRAPLTGVVLIAEMTGNFDLLFVLLVASLTAYLFAELVGGKPIYQALMELDLRKLDPGTGQDEEPVIVDVTVEANSKMSGLTVADLKLPAGCLMITIRKQGVEKVPHGTTLLEEGDKVTFLVDRNARDQLVGLREAAESPS